MGIILGKASNPHQSVQSSGKLMSVNQSEFCQSLGQIPVRMKLSFINQHSSRTIHRLNGKISFIYFCKVHIFLIVIPMSRTVPELFIQYNRSPYFLIPCFFMLFSPILLQNVSQNHTFRHEEWESGSLFQDIKKIQLFSKLPVIPLFCLLQSCEICIQFAFFIEGSSIDSLKHLVFLVASPISTSYR